MKRGVGIAALMALAAAGCGAPPDPDMSLRRDVLDALAPYRTTEARFSGGIHHAPCERAADSDDLLPRARCASLPEPGSRAFDRITRVTRELRERLRATESPVLIHTAAVADAILGHDDPDALDRAITRLDELRALGHGGADLLNDLAAAYLVRAEVRQDPMDLAATLEFSRRASNAGSAHDEAGFNEGLALERLGLLEPAHAVLQGMATSARGRDWRSEAQARGEALRRAFRAPPGTWQASMEAALGGEDPTALGITVAAAPRLARQHVLQELLPTWARHVIAGEEGDAARTLKRALMAARALSAGTGDAEIEDAVRAIARRPTPEDRTLHVAVAAAHRDLEEARRHREELGRYDEAERLAMAALPPLRRIGSPLAIEADALLGAVELHTGRIAQGAERFERLIRDVDTQRHPLLGAWVRWGAALAAVRRGELQTARSGFGQAADLYTAAGDPHNAAVMRHLSAEVLFAGNRLRESLSESVHAARAIAAEGPSRWLRTAYLQTGATLARGGHPRAAEAALTAALEVARTLGNGSYEAESLIQRATVLLDAGEVSQARRDLGEAEAALRDVSLARSYLIAQLELVRSRIRLSEAGSETTRLAELARTLETEGRETLLPDVEFRLARAHLSAGDTGSAWSSITGALTRIDAVRADFRGSPLDEGFLRGAERVFDLAVELAASAGRANAALAYLEDSRPPSPGGRVRTDRQRGDVLTVTYAVLEGRTVAWVAASGPATLHTLDVDSAALGALVRRWRDRGYEPDAPEAEKLSDLLIQPFHALLVEGGTLRVVPDRILVQVPFAILPLGSSLVLDRVEVTYRQSSYESRGAHALPVPRDAGAPRRAIIIGDPAFDGAWFGGLTRLPGARREAEDLARVLPDATILLDTAATARRLVETLPSHNLLHFAGHGVSAPSSEGGHLVLAPDESGLTQLNDVRIRQLDLTGLELAVLSACSTAEGLPGRNGGVLGLAAAFLDAGARGVVASLGIVDDGSTAPLMSRFHVHLRAGMPAPAALRAAQREAAEAWRRGEGPPPGSWGAFVFVEA